mmetsp:Transcript_11576/g.40508  ORF Transcript_11576/g.40508 Transcript_11576/m.40508 type:complete len:444 (+) Transcript_11576:2474-3805(+)
MEVHAVLLVDLARVWRRDLELGRLRDVHPPHAPELSRVHVVVRAAVGHDGRVLVPVAARVRLKVREDDVLGLCRAADRRVRRPEPRRLLFQRLAAGRVVRGEQHADAAHVVVARHVAHLHRPQVHVARARLRAVLVVGGADDERVVDGNHAVRHQVRQRGRPVCVKHDADVVVRRAVVRHLPVRRRPAEQAVLPVRKSGEADDLHAAEAGGLHVVDPHAETRRVSDVAERARDVLVEPAARADALLRVQAESGALAAGRDVLDEPVARADDVKRGVQQGRDLPLIGVNRLPRRRRARVHHQVLLEHVVVGLVEVHARADRLVQHVAPQAEAVRAAPQADTLAMAVMECAVLHHRQLLVAGAAVADVVEGKRIMLVKPVLATTLKLDVAQADAAAAPHGLLVARGVVGDRDARARRSHLASKVLRCRGLQPGAVASADDDVAVQ